MSWIFWQQVENAICGWVTGVSGSPEILNYFVSRNKVTHAEEWQSFQIGQSVWCELRSGDVMNVRSNIRVLYGSETTRTSMG